MRLSDAEYELAEATARRAGMSLIAYARKALMAAAMAAAVSCFGSSSPNDFPRILDADRELFFSCWSSVRPHVCGDDRNTLYVGICERAAQKKYADRPSSKRHNWLVAHGCPKDMVAAATEEDEEDER